MKKLNLKKLLPHIIALLVFLSLPLIYFHPILEGKAIKQGDITNFKGMSKEISDFREKYHEDPLWTNSMFGGMPAYQISVLYPANLVKYADKILTLGLPHPAGIVFLYLLGFYILLMTLKIDPWLGIVGAIAFALSSYFFIIIEAGHNSKAHAIGYMAPVFAGVILTFRGKYLTGGILTAFFLALELISNHLQITYYLLILLLIYGIVEAFNAYKNKTYLPFVKSVGVLVVAVLLSVATNITGLWATYDYGKYTTRGKSDLTFDKENKTTGLDKDYATGWSYGKAETMSLMIPDFKGGASGSIGANKDALKDVDPKIKQQVAGMDQYWGDQPFTSGPVYVGAIIFFLCILGLFILEGTFKWVLFIATVTSILLSWGHNFMGLTELFLDYFPGYNKFRAVSMILVIAELTIPLMAVLVLDKLLRNTAILKEKVKIPFSQNFIDKQKLFIIAFALTGGLALLYYLFPQILTNFSKSNEYEQLFSQIKRSNPSADDAQVGEYINSILPGVEIARISIFKADAVRSFLMILLAAAVIWFYLKSKFNYKLLLATLLIFILADMWSVDKRYLNDSNFVSSSEAKMPYKPTEADLQILEDKDPDFRVYNASVNTFNDASTSYFHKSIGGYHGAKLKRYQELIEYQISKNNMSVLNMLNTKYFILPGENNMPKAQRNPEALGNVWFVKEYKLVPNADSEITALSNFDPAKTAVIDAKFKSDIKDFKYIPDSTAAIKLLDYKPNHLIYQSTSATEQMAVFSEIYYKDGWNVYVDGKSSAYFRANYLLRAMLLPAGNHKIEFKFEPSIFAIGEKISLASSALLLLLVIGVFFVEIKKMLAKPQSR